MRFARYSCAVLLAIVFLVLHAPPLLAEPLGNVTDFGPVNYTLGNQTYLWVVIKNVGAGDGVFTVYAWQPDSHWNLVANSTNYTLGEGGSLNLTSHFRVTPDSLATPGNFTIKINHTVGWDNSLTKYVWVNTSQNDAGSGRDAHSN